MSNTSHYHDLIIVGSGGGSMCAALYAASRGKKVLVLEKSGYYGGTTARSGGVMWIPNNRFMKRDGVEDSFERARTYLEALAETFEDAPGATPERRERFLKEAPAMIDFLVEQGLELDRVPFWPDYNDELSGGCKTSRCVVAAPFNKKALGEWADKLRPGFLDLPATLDEAL
ncbi:FAD-dependent oxidoreductase, partial [Litorivivens sp.]